MHPDVAYLVCSTPRSGSTLLCELLTATGAAGRPQDYFERLYATNKPRQPRQYFNRFDDQDVIDQLEPTTHGTPESAEAFDERVRSALRDGTTANGVWASKMMWHYLLDVLRRLREKPDTAALKPAAALGHLFGDLSYVQVKRRDKVPQAVSLWTSLQTAAEPVYSFTAIEHLVTRLTAQDQAWATWFVASGIDPIVVFYEDLVADPRGAVRDLLRSLHIDTHTVEFPGEVHDPAARGSAEWAERFEHDRKAALV